MSQSTGRFRPTPPNVDTHDSPESDRSEIDLSDFASRLGETPNPRDSWPAWTDEVRYTVTSVMIGAHPRRKGGRA